MSTIRTHYTHSYTVTTAVHKLHVSDTLNHILDLHRLQTDTDSSGNVVS